MDRLFITPRDRDTDTDTDNIGPEGEGDLSSYQQLMRRYSLGEFDDVRLKPGSSSYYEALQARQRLVELNQNLKGSKLDFSGRK
jgi:hypothetical protein